MLLYRGFGLALAVAGAGLLLFLSYALFTRAEAGPSILVHIGMPAALLATLLWFAATLVFGWYVTRFANYSRVYGSGARSAVSLPSRQASGARVAGSRRRLKL